MSGAELLLVAIKPDAVAAGKSSQILDKVRAIGIEPTSWRMVQGDEATRVFELIYRQNLVYHHSPNMIGHWWLASRLFQLGPTVLLACRGDIAAVGLIDRGKGASQPSASIRGTIRFDLGATTRVTNLVHVSDAATAEHELETAFGSAASLPPSDLGPVLQGLDRTATWHGSLYRSALRQRIGRLLARDERDDVTTALLSLWNAAAQTPALRGGTAQGIPAWKVLLESESSLLADEAPARAASFPRLTAATIDDVPSGPDAADGAFLGDWDRYVLRCAQALAI